MKLSDSQFTNASLRIIAAAALIATLAFAPGLALAADKEAHEDRAELRIKDMTAVDDLKSYGDITEAHLNGIRKLTPLFADLYAGMSDPQKKEADTLFRHGDRKHNQKRGHKKLESK